MAASNPDAKFVFNYLSEDNYLVNLDKTDEEFIADYNQAGQLSQMMRSDAPIRQFMSEQPWGKRKVRVW